MSTTGTPCPCGLGEVYDACCGRLHRGAAQAPTAERLMRSRYAAFALGDVGYLSRTWHPDHRPRRVVLDPTRVWQRLEIVAAQGGSFLDTEGTVEFRAHYLEQGRPGVQHERSRFVRVDRHWLYAGTVT